MKLQRNSDMCTRAIQDTTGLDISKGVPKAYVDMLSATAGIIASEMHGVDLGDVVVSLFTHEFDSRTWVRFDCSMGSSLIGTSDLMGMGFIDPCNPLWDAVMQDLIGIAV